MLPADVLITPARNEAQFIELTLRSMVVGPFGRSSGSLSAMIQRTKRTKSWAN